MIIAFLSFSVLTDLAALVERRVGGGGSSDNEILQHIQ